MVLNIPVLNLDREITMSNPGFGVYNNNNYIPGIGQLNPIQLPQQDGMNFNNKTTYIPGIETYSTPGNGNTSIPFPGNVCYPGTFTFAVPTQASVMVGTFTQSTQPRVLIPGTRIFGAPGIGASWQHNVPRLMPWQDAMSGQTNNGISTFTGLLPSVSHYEGYSDFMKGSTSNSSRRLKRQALDSIKEESPENKIFISEEKMAKRMRGLSLNCQSSSPSHSHHRSSSSSSSQSTSSFIPISSQYDSYMLSDSPVSFSNTMSNQNTCSSYSMLTDGIRRLKEIEDRLEVDSTDEDRQEEITENSEPRLRFTGVSESELLNPNPILPKQLLQDLNKPCLQVVLWRPPGGDITQFISSSSHRSEDIKDKDDQLNTIDQQNDQMSVISSDIASTTEKSFAASSEMESMEDDDDMDL